MKGVRRYWDVFRSLIVHASSRLQGTPEAMDSQVDVDIDHANLVLINHTGAPIDVAISLIDGNIKYVYARAHFADKRIMVPWHAMCGADGREYSIRAAHFPLDIQIHLSFTTGRVVKYVHLRGLSNASMNKGRYKVMFSVMSSDTTA